MNINLKPRPRIQAALRKARIELWVGIDLIFCMIVLVGTMFFTSSYASNRTNLNDEISFAQARISNTQRTIDMLEPGIVKTQLTLQASRAVTKQPDWSKLLAMTSQLQGQQIVLQSCSLDPIKQKLPPVSENDADAPRQTATRIIYQFKLAGIGLTQQSVSEFALRLEKLELFGRVSVIKTQRQPFLTVQAVGFEIVCQLAGHQEKTDG